jgi:hydrogenase small subunit
LTRRDFVKVCTAAAVYLGLDASFGATIAEAATAKRLPVVWISGQECTGCTETLLRATHPTLEHLILDLISLDYHETLLSGAGKQAEEALETAVKAGGYVMVAEGAFPTKDGGVYCVGGADRRYPRRRGPPRGGLHHNGLLLSGLGCQRQLTRPRARRGRGPQDEGRRHPGDGHRLPPNPYNFAAVLYFVTFGKLPELDDKDAGFAYGRLITGERRPH